MFSVGATPFNSAARMRYGGWATTDMADAANPVSGDPKTDYRNYVAWKMQADLDWADNTTPAIRATARQAARDINAYYRTLGKVDPYGDTYRAWKAIKSAWRPPQNKTSLSKAQRLGLYNTFGGIDWSDDPTEDVRNRLATVRNAPFRPMPDSFYGLDEQQIKDIQTDAYWKARVAGTPRMIRRVGLNPADIAYARWAAQARRLGYEPAAPPPPPAPVPVVRRSVPA